MCKQPTVAVDYGVRGQVLSTVDDYHYLLITLGNQLLCIVQWAIGRDGLLLFIVLSFLLLQH